MMMIRRAIACGFLLFAPIIYGQDNPVERHISEFDSKGVGLTETMLKFAHQEHLPIAIEYVDRASMDEAVDVSVKNTTVGRGLDTILQRGNGYRWTLRNGIIEVTNRHASQHAERQLNRVIPVFDIAGGPTSTVMMASAALWRDLQMELDPSLKGKGYIGELMGRSSTVKPATLRNRTVREILSYIVVNSQAEGWVVAGPPKCLGYTPFCGLWYFIEGEPFDSSYQSVLRKVHENL